MGKGTPEEQARKSDEKLVADLAKFREDVVYLLRTFPGEMSASGDDVLGFSLSRKPDGWLLVIRAKVDGLRQVAFLFDPTTTGCVSLASLKAKNGTLHWRDDDFA